MLSPASISGVVACLLLATVVGCGGTAPQPLPEALVADEVDASDDKSDSPAAEQAESPKKVAKKPPKYQPPFPQRAELFVPPSTGKRIVRHKNGSLENSVELLGFVQVDEPHAVLAIDGVVSPVALGSEKNGVQVISIQPPVAVLQRGRSRWPARLE